MINNSEEDIKKELYKGVATLHIDGMRVDKAQPDEVIMSMKIKNSMCNIYGIAHGGAVYTLIDTAAAAIIWVNGMEVVTQNSSVSFLRGCKNGTTVYAKSKLMHKGRSTCVSEVILEDSDGKRVAIGTFTMFNSKNRYQKIQGGSNE